MHGSTRRPESGLLSNLGRTIGLRGEELNPICRGEQRGGKRTPSAELYYRPLPYRQLEPSKRRYMYRNSSDWRLKARGINEQIVLFSTKQAAAELVAAGWLGHPPPPALRERHTGAPMCMSRHTASRWLQRAWRAAAQNRCATGTKIDKSRAEKGRGRRQLTSNTD